MQVFSCYSVSCLVFLSTLGVFLTHIPQLLSEWQLNGSFVKKAKNKQDTFNHVEKRAARACHCFVHLPALPVVATSFCCCALSSGVEWFVWLFVFFLKLFLKPTLVPFTRKYFPHCFLINSSDFLNISFLGQYKDSDLR